MCGPHPFLQIVRIVSCDEHLICQWQYDDHDTSHGFLLMNT
jgi:hypothetical protein